MLEQAVDPEAVAVSRRFIVALILGIPLFVIAMLDMFPLAHRFDVGTLLLIQWALATPIVAWCGWPIFQRAWLSWQQRSTNMFTLIAIGVGAAYAYSAAALIDFVTGVHLLPMTEHGMVDAYFESAGAIIVLVLAGQVIEARARRHTGSAIRSLLAVGAEDGSTGAAGQ